MKIVLGYETNANFIKLQNTAHLFLHLPVMAVTDIQIEAADLSYMSDIELLASKMELDREDLKASEFLLAKEGEKVIGIGRLREYAGRKWKELATLGVIRAKRKRGIARSLIRELTRKEDEGIYLTTVIPDFFSKFGFVPVSEYPPELEKKVDFCRSYDFKDEEIFVMKLKK